MTKRKYCVGALAKFIYEHCGMNPDKAAQIASTLLSEYDIAPKETVYAPVAQLDRATDF